MEGGLCIWEALFLSTPSARRATCQSPPARCLRRHFYPRPPRGGRRTTKALTRRNVNFYPRPPRGGRHRGGVGRARCHQFLSTPSARRATRGKTVYELYRSQFLSTPSARRATRSYGSSRSCGEFLSTPSARRATCMAGLARFELAISIHALREEGDHVFDLLFHPHPHFYPRPPRGGRHTSCSIGYVTSIFLSTPSARRATGRPGRPISPGGISIHALREEGDMVHHHHPRRGFYFYPRPPRGGRLNYNAVNYDEVVISIHALREEGDMRKQRQRENISLFLSTPSARRATAGVFNAMYTGAEFLSTPSARRATHTSDNTLWSTLHFYPRPPRGGRQRFLTTLVVNLDFYPRPPRGGRLYKPASAFICIKISIHALREEGDLYHWRNCSVVF